MFKRYLTIILALILLIAASAGCRRSDDEPEKKSSIELKITRLTVSDKIDIDYELISDSSIPDGRIRVKAVSGKGEKTESVFEKADTVTLDAPAKGGTVDIEVIFEDENGKTFDKAVLRTKDGLVQLTDDSIPLVVAEMTDVEKAQLIAGTGNPKKAGASGGTYEIERLGVPSITVNDGPAGVRYGTSVWYPSVMNMTSSWDGELINKVGRAMGEDSLALGIDIVLAPGMNIQKNVLGGRNFEYCSEDPLLTAFSASAYVKGMQSAGAGACLKHFVANEQETSRGSVSSTMTERALREIYLKPFQLAVRDSSPVSIMSSYNQLNGIHNSINKELLTGILRAEWGYKGMVMTDWGAAGA
ncbi:MAG: glycoside hydrolase family 3 protein, partial [Clostridia bacterium]|nr:glycoside hydrolase family 3 protein [Clostridia bacterium]